MDDYSKKNERVRSADGGGMNGKAWRSFAFAQTFGHGTRPAQPCFLSATLANCRERLPGIDKLGSLVRAKYLHLLRKLRHLLG
jgi:hypothetical protein